jgi:acyl-coenzyme A synthetase/AMP-(fatty) acid ligase
LFVSFRNVKTLLTCNVMVLVFIIVYQVVFAGFSAESLAQRIIDCKPKALLTCNAVRRGAKVINLKEIVDAALVESSKNGVSVGMHLQLSIPANIFLLVDPSDIEGLSLW